MKIKTDMKKQSVGVSKLLSPVAYILLSISFVYPIFAADRFAPPTLSASIDDFNKRSTSSSLNISYIVARVLNEARLIRQAGDDFRDTASIFNNQTGNSDAVSNSVVIPPGTRADTIIVINQNDGDSYAIHR